MANDQQFGFSQLISFQCSIDCIGEFFIVLSGVFPFAGGREGDFPGLPLHCRLLK